LIVSGNSRLIKKVSFIVIMRLVRLFLRFRIPLMLNHKTFFFSIINASGFLREKLLLILLFSPIVILAQYPPTTVALDSTKLPILLINTNGQAIVDDPKVTADFKIIYDSLKVYQKPTDIPNDYNGKIGIELRGNSSLTFPKKSFTFETRKVDGSNNNVSLLGMPEENDWTLIANHIEKTLIKNELMYWLWGNTGAYSVRTRMCEVVLNGTYIGVYLLTEKIKRDKNRVDINKLKDDEITGEDLTGGYIFRRDPLKNNVPENHWFPQHYNTYKPFIVTYPEYGDLQPEQFNYIKNYVQSFENALYGSFFTDPTLGYHKYIDEQSFADYCLIEEFSLNADAYDGSRYFYKDKNGELFTGPVWDFDEALSNSSECYSTTNAAGWLHVGDNCIAVGAIFWWKKLGLDCTYSNLLRNRYTKFRSEFLNTTTIFNHIDSLSAISTDAALRNHTAWGHTPDFTNRITDLKNWISQRLIWMDANLYKITKAIPTITASVTTAHYGSTVNLITGGCQTGGTPIWSWENANFSGAVSGGNNQFLKIQSDMTVYVSCNYDYGCLSEKSKALNIKLDLNNIGCASVVNLTNSIVNDGFPKKYQSSGTAIIQSKVDAGAKLLLQSNKEVILKPGFESDATTIFKAQINPCNSE
jgi:hypothetical protein